MKKKEQNFFSQLCNQKKTFQLALAQSEHLGQSCFHHKCLALKLEAPMENLRTVSDWSGFKQCKKQEYPVAVQLAQCVLTTAINAKHSKKRDRN